ncbi:MAG: hypothetical protein ACI3YH_07070 [Eubacteriales bacterium]
MMPFFRKIGDYCKQNWRQMLHALLYPRAWVVVLSTLLGGGATVAIFLLRWEESPLAVPAYIAAFYALTVLTIRSIRYFPRWYRSGKDRVNANPYGNRFLCDLHYRTTVTLYGSLTVNLLYVLLNAISCAHYRTAWFGILAGYYTILAIMRFLLVRYASRVGIGKNSVREHQRSRACGVILLALNLTLTGTVWMILYQDRGYQYNGILIYVMAAYTFYITIHAVIDIIRFRKYNSPVMSAAKRINLSAALVSMLALETAMIAQFGGDSGPMFRRIMVAATGAGVSIVVIVLSVTMIVTANRAIRSINEKKC